MSAQRNSKKSRLATFTAHDRQAVPQSAVPTGQDPMTFFSEEVTLHIFEALSPSDLGTCACVSRLWHRLVNDQLLWRRLFHNYQFIHPRGFTIPDARGDLQLSNRSSSGRQPKRKHTSHRTETLQQLQGRYQLSDRQICWKALYRLNHNWVMGQARVTSISTRELTKQDQDPVGLTTTFQIPGKVALPRIRDKDRLPIVQFKGSVILIANPCGVLQFWRIRDSPSVDATPTGCTQSSLWQICQYPAQGNSFAIQDVRDTFQITCLAMDTSDKSSNGSQHVMVGYDSGHFSVLEYTLLDGEKNQGDTKGQQPGDGLNLREIGNTAKLPAWSDVGRIESAAFHHPILTTCSDDGAISIYQLETKSTIVGPHHWCRLLHRLYGSSPESPIGIRLEGIKPQSDTLSDNSEGGQWRALVSFGLELYSGSWTMRLQEIEFDEHYILHSTEIGALDKVDEGYESPMSGLGSFNCNKANGYAQTGPISAVSISWPLVVTAHSDNTMNVFQMARVVDLDSTGERSSVIHQTNSSTNLCKGQLRFRHLSTLYGHCGAVSSVSIESRSCRLVSASMDRSIKIWTVATNYHEGQHEKPSLHQCSVSLSDINKSWTESGQVTKEEGLGLIWVGSDEEKIVSMNCDGTVKVWQFS